MGNSRRRALGTLAGTLIILATLLEAGTVSAAPQRATRIEHLNKLAAVGKNLIARLRPAVLASLSGGGQSLVNLSERGDEITSRVGNQQNSGNAQDPRQASAGFANDPYAAEDLLTRFSGMTQSETTVGWCGDTALVGFNDSGSFVSTLILNESPTGSLSFDGYSRSTNRGTGFTDMGALIADPLPAGIMFRDLLGDPVIGCTSPSNFYYASLATDSGFKFSFVNTGISVSRSTNGGASFGGAVMAVAKDANLHFLDKPWMAVNPGPTNGASDDAIQVTYTDFDFSFTTCPDTVRAAIEHVRSTDGGRTWSAPRVIDEVCSESSFVQGSQVETGAASDVYVAWEHYTNPDSDRDIRIVKSTNGGSTFGTVNVVGPVTPIGDGFVLQGNFRTFIDLQGLAVDKSQGSTAGNVYISWHDGRNRSKVDPFGFCGGTSTYCFGDVLLSRSTNGGTSWAAPTRVNNDDISLGIDQFFPAVDVDASGNVWTAFYDRRGDDRNLLIDTFLAKSTNGGRAWDNNRLTARSFPPITGWQDFVVNPSYMGDYIAVAADATGRNPGVIVAWGDNSLGDSNVLVTRR
jgi:hypothetical protein